MSLDDLQQHWRDEVQRPMSAAEVQQLLEDVQQRYDKLERSVHRRDVQEILAALIVVAAFGALWPLFRTSRIAILGVLIIVAGAALIVYRLLSTQKPVPLPFNSSVLEFSRQRLTWLDGQIHLLQTVAWWYVAPIFVGCLLIFWGLTGVEPVVFGLLALFDIAVAALVIRMNRQAVRQELRPVRDEVARLIEVLTASPTN